MEAHTVVCQFLTISPGLCACCHTVSAITQYCLWQCVFMPFIQSLGTLTPMVIAIDILSDDGVHSYLLAEIGRIPLSIIPSTHVASATASLSLSMLVRSSRCCQLRYSSSSRVLSFSLPRVQSMYVLTVRDLLAVLRVVYHMLHSATLNVNYNAFMTMQS